MSFTRALVTLAGAFAAVKGVEKYREMGGMAGVQKAMQDNPALKNMQGQMGEMMTKMGIPGAEHVNKMMDQFAGQTEAAGAGAAAGVGGLMSAMGGAMAAGSENSAKMMDAMSGNTMASDAMDANAKLMIRAMIQGAKADGEIDEEEQAKILEHLGELNAAERKFVMEEMAAPVDPVALARDTSDQMAAQVYATSLMAMKVDTMKEADYLNNLAQALNLSDDARKRVHKAMGVK